MANVYKVILSREAVKQLDKLSNSVAEPIIAAIGMLSLDPRPPGCKKLKGRDGYRIRIGNYRVIYEVLDKELVVDVITLGHRKEVYD